jgi:hypothetical protein
MSSGGTGEQTHESLDPPQLETSSLRRVSMSIMDFSPPPPLAELHSGFYLHEDLMSNKQAKRLGREMINDGHEILNSNKFSFSRLSTPAQCDITNIL